MARKKTAILMHSANNEVNLFLMNSTYHTIIKMKSVDIKPNIYIDFNRENNKWVGDHVRI